MSREAKLRAREAKVRRWYARKYALEFTPEAMAMQAGLLRSREQTTDERRRMAALLQGVAAWAGW